MSCLTSTSPIDINPSRVSGDCEAKCAFTFKYPNISCSATNRGTYISLLYEPTSNPPVTFNTTGYNVNEVRIYSPSLHTFNSKNVAAEIIIIHNSVKGGKPLLVCIPVMNSNSSTTSSNLLDKIVTSVANSCPSEGECSQVNIDSYSLNSFIQNKPYFSYSGTTPYQPCSQDVDFIVFGRDSATIIMDSTLQTLNQIISDSKTKTVTNNEFFINPKGPNQAESDEIYIDCQPVNVSEETVEVSKKKSDPTPINFNSLIKNPVFIAIMGSLIFIIILYIGKLVLNVISGENIELPEFVSKLGSKSKSTE